MRMIAMAAGAMLLGACAAVGPASYGAADAKGFGYEETRIEADRYRVVYRGSGGMPPELVEDFALRRAAELAQSNGYDWFQIVARSMDREERGGVGVGAGFGTGSYGRRSGVSVGVGGDLGTIGGNQYFTARLEVLMGEGEAPEDSDAYDAASVLESFASSPEGY
ncbi:MAG: hypothetical protein HKP25_13470 [Marinicaulis sp.]|nr:hypothetical protein [Marinicaulis sp.]